MANLYHHVPMWYIYLNSLNFPATFIFAPFIFRALNFRAPPKNPYQRSIFFSYFSEFYSCRRFYFCRYSSKYAVKAVIFGYYCFDYFITLCNAVTCLAIYRIRSFFPPHLFTLFEPFSNFAHL